MNPTPSRSLLVAAAIAFAFAAAPARAAEEAPLPPEKPTTPYRAQVRSSYEIATSDGGKSGGDTLEIRVSGARLFVDSKLLHEPTTIVDLEKLEVIEFDAKAPEKVAKKFTLNEEPVPYIGGRAALAAYDPDWPAPKVAGQDTVAGEKCTILQYGDPAEKGIAACVSKAGVVMRAKIKFPDYQREFEILDLDAGKQDEKWFAPPKEFRVVDGSAE